MEFELDLKGKSPYSILALYKYFRINDANRSTNGTTSKQAAQTGTNFEITEILKRRNFKSDTERGDANHISVYIVENTKKKC